ncbi:hypothetical protein [Roseovarius pelagicus]|uniref:Uncharacterized protein n=1 Tax=Roseovarius pelagicus TaxID=2980108 RepID=A0ABY6D800_9RHOB|nr:hypothetical protein [Roseovarius pelagicus]UXX82262.1 hypothetical protein N7U68_14280 [Roseovarius pelagicus]
MPYTSTPSNVDDATLNRRIRFHDDIQTMEVDFSNFHFGSSAIVNRFYDRLEARIAATDEPQWFFLINLTGTRIDPIAWTPYSRRGRALNLAHSMGSVRYDASDDTRRQIIRAANTDAFDPNLFADRDAALARIAELPSTRRTKVVHDPTYALSDIVRRVHFDEDRQIMNVDFSHFTLNHSRDVDDVYDYLEERIKESGRKWFFLIDMNGCQIMPGACIPYAARGKSLNLAASLGSVRYATGSETEADIRLRAESQGFRPNIRNTRAEALALIDEMRAALT